MDKEDQETEINPSPSSFNVSLVDAEAMETRASDMQKDVAADCAGEEGEIPASLQSNETDNDTVTQVMSAPSSDEASAFQTQHNECTPAQEEGLNQDECVADDTFNDTARKEDGLIEGELPLQVEEEPDARLNGGECTADKEEGLAEGNALGQIEHEQDAELNDGTCAVDDASMNTMQQEDESTEGEALSQTGQEEFVESNDQGARAAIDSIMDSMQNEGEGEALDQIEQEPFAGSNKDESAAVDTSMKTMQKEEGLAEGDVPIQSGKEPDVGLQNEGECAADDASMDITSGETTSQIEQEPVLLNEGEFAAEETSIVTTQKQEGLGKGEASIQLEQEPDVGSEKLVDASMDITSGETTPQIEQEPVGLNEGESAGDETSVDTTQKEGELGKDMALIQLEQEPDLGSDEVECAADEASLADMYQVEGSAGNEAPIQIKPESDVEIPADDCKPFSVEAPAAAEKSALDSANQLEQLGLESGVDDAVVLDSSALMREPSLCTPAMEAESGVDDALVLAALTKEPSLCTPAMEALMVADDQDLDGDETLEEIAGNAVQSGFINQLEPEDCSQETSHNSIASEDNTSSNAAWKDGRELSVEVSSGDECNGTVKELWGELPEVSKQDMETKQPVVQESNPEPHVKKELHIEASLAAEEEPILKESSATLEMADEKQLEALPLVDNRNEQELGLDIKHTKQARQEGEAHVAARPMTLEQDVDVNNTEEGRITECDQGGGEEAMNTNRSSSTDLENGDLHKIEVNPVWECGKMMDGGEQPNKNGQFGTQLDEASNAVQWEEMVGGAQTVEASMDVGVPLSSMVHENGFLQHNEENLMGQHYTAYVNAQPTQNNKSLQISRSLVVPQQNGDYDKKDAERVNGNATLVHRSTNWWGCCGMLDALLHKD